MLSTISATACRWIHNKEGRRLLPVAAGTTAALLLFVYNWNRAKQRHYGVTAAAGGSDDDDDDVDFVDPRVHALALLRQNVRDDLARITKLIETLQSAKSKTLLQLETTAPSSGSSEQEEEYDQVCADFEAMVKKSFVLCDELVTKLLIRIDGSLQSPSSPAGGVSDGEEGGMDEEIRTTRRSLIREVNTAGDELHRVSHISRKEFEDAVSARPTPPPPVDGGDVGEAEPKATTSTDDRDQSAELSDEREDKEELEGDDDAAGDEAPHDNNDDDVE